MDTNKMLDISREQFEAWFRKEYQLEAGDEINFANGGVRMMLKGWQASREAVVVDLPPRGALAASDSPWEVFDACREAIEVQGLKVAP
ncbi:hypothetical protein MXM82_10930 [Pseudomonas asiatica]|uniref:hypothetical protein n=1 Tax=Pseudomonas asiatica TaxID=2219225 RepID=UPI002DB7787C|nr:hypothetical protein [Pseudomonas asiatica]MEB6589642.1 hypothetical protein [Pseudomonas asiatica]